MKINRYNKAAVWMLAALATLVVVGTLPADEAGQVRLSDFDAPAAVTDIDSEIVVRGASDLRSRNARTAQSLRRMLSNVESSPKSTGAIQQVKYKKVTSVSNCCPTEGCCPTCAAPAGGCAPVCAAPAECCPPACATPVECCPPACAAPAACCPQSCAAPVGCCPPDQGCCPAPNCACPPGNCDSCAPASCACPATNACDGCAAVGRVHIGDGCSMVSGCDGCDGNGYSSNGGRGGRGLWGSQGSCQHGYGQGGCPICNSSSCVNRNCFASFLGEQAAAHRARNRLASANLNQYLHCKLGYFIPDGNGGVGSPLFGHYSIVYPVDSGYFDGRDGEVYAAQGYGGAVSVPLAPTVRATYNYGWGIPSSRLTPVSNATP